MRRFPSLPSGRSTPAGGALSGAGEVRSAPGSQPPKKPARPTQACESWVTPPRLNSPPRPPPTLPGQITVLGYNPAPRLPRRARAYRTSWARPKKRRQPASPDKHTDPTLKLLTPGKAAARRGLVAFSICWESNALRAPRSSRLERALPFARSMRRPAKRGWTSDTASFKCSRGWL